MYFSGNIIGDALIGCVRILWIMISVLFLAFYGVELSKTIIIFA